MGLTDALARYALRATHVLVVEVPGEWRTRVGLEQQMLRRGWRPAWTPADADVLAVCGIPGPALAENVGQLWEQMPGPRVRADIGSLSHVSSALDDAATLLLDTPHHRADAQNRPERPQLPEPHGQSDDDGMDHGGHGHHGEHQSADHSDMGHGGHDGMDHGGHGGMDMAPEGIPLATGGQDRDGLEMDVLHLPWGPVLPFWPAGLVLRCALQGDVVVEAGASVIDDAHHHGPGEGHPAQAPWAAVRCDNAMALLALAGAEDVAVRARRARDALLDGNGDAARDAVTRLHRAVRRSRLLRWSLRGVLPLTASDLEDHGLPMSCLGDAHDRLVSLVERVRAQVHDRGPMNPSGTGAVVWDELPHLMTGLELATVRLAVASLDLDPLPGAREVARA